MHNFLQRWKSMMECDDLQSSPTQGFLISLKGFSQRFSATVVNELDTLPTLRSQKCSSQCIFLLFISSLAALLPLPPQSHSAPHPFMTSPVLFSLSVCELLCLCSPLYLAFNTISLIQLICQKPAFYMIIRSALCSTIV